MAGAAPICSDDCLQVRLEIPRRLVAGEEPWPRRSGAGDGWPGSASASFVAATVTCHSVQADDPLRVRRAPVFEMERHTVSWSASSDSGTSSVSSARPSPSRATRSRFLFCRSERPASGAPVHAVRLRRGAVRPEVRRERVLDAELLLPRPPGGRRVAGDEDDLGLGVPGRTEVLLQVARFVLAHGVKANGWKTSRTFERPRKSDSCTRSWCVTSRSNSGALSPVVTFIRALLASASRAIVTAPPQLVREMRHVEPGRVVVRIDVSLSVAARSLAAPLWPVDRSIAGGLAFCADVPRALPRSRRRTRSTSVRGRGRSLPARD